MIGWSTSKPFALPIGLVSEVGEYMSPFLESKINLIQIFPRAGDDWEQSPPIQGQYSDKSLIFAYGSVSNSREYLSSLGTVVEGYLESFSSFSNEINFLQKTKVGQKTDTTTTDGIGGLAKLKDFEFTLIKSGVTITDFIGCYVEVFTLDEDTLSREIHFKGKIYTPSTTRTSVSYVVRGVLSANETYIEGKKNGDQNDTIFLGGGQKYIKLQKRLDKVGNTKLIFDPDKYEIHGIYVSDKDSEKKSKDKIYYPVTTDYKIIEDEIIFTSLNTSVQILEILEDKVGGGFIFKTDAGVYVGFVFPSGTSQEDITTVRYIDGQNFADTKLAYKFIQVLSLYGETFYVYRTTPCGGYETVLADILDGKFNLFTSSGTLLPHPSRVLKLEECPIPNSLGQMQKDRDVLDYYSVLMNSNSGMPLPQELNLCEIRKRGETDETLVFDTSKVIYKNDGTYLYNIVSSGYFQVGDYIEIISQKGTQDYVYYSIEKQPKRVLNTSFGISEDYLDSFGRLKLQLKNTFEQAGSFLGDSIIRKTNEEGLQDEAVSDYANDCVTLDFGLEELSGNLSKLHLSFEFIPVYREPITKEYTLSIGNTKKWDMSQRKFTFKEDFSTSYPLNTPSLKAMVDSGAISDYSSVLANPFAITLTRFVLGTEVENVSVYLEDILLSIELELSIKDNDFYALVSEKQTSTFFLWAEIQRINLATLCGYTPINYACSKLWFKSAKFIDIACSNGIQYKGFRFSLERLSADLLNLFLKNTVSTVGDAPLVISESGKPSRYFWDNTENSLFNCGDGSESSAYSLVNKALEAENFGTNTQQEFYFDDYKVVTNGLELVLFKKQSGISMSNPVGIIYRLLTQYAKIPVEFFNTDLIYETALRREGWKAELMVSSAEAINDLVDTLAKEHGLFVFENNMGLITILSLDPPSEDVVSLELGRDDILIGEIDETYTGIEYLISQLDTTYSDDEEKLECSSLDQTPFSVARKYLNGDEVQMNLVLKTVFDGSTAQNSAELKQLYHYIPTRILKIAVRPELGIGLGDWVKISEDSGIDLVRGKIYLVQFIEKMLFEDAVLNLELYEFDIDTLADFIQEVPSHPDEITEVIDSGDEISELII